jgi:hypothetical protein
MKYKSKILYFILATLSLSSCSDFLDQVPDEKLSEEILFDSKDDVIRIITQIYYNQGNPLGFGNSEIDDIPGTSGDDVDYIWNNYSPHKNLGQYSASSPIYKQWGRYYESIRLAMYFIGKIDTCNDPKLLENEKQ